jgi:hypothetical protein
LSSIARSIAAALSGRQPCWNAAPTTSMFAGM